MNMMNAHVLGSAVVNVTANTKGLTDGLSQTRQQLSGFLTFANSIGGRYGGGIASAYSAIFHGGGGALGAVNNAMQWHRQTMAAQGQKVTRAGLNEAAAGAAVPAGQAAIVLAGVIGAASALSVGLKKAAEVASEFEEALDKTKQTFGSNKGIISEQADKLASQYGISRRETHGLSSRAGLLLQSAGVEEEQSAKMATNLAKLSAEASSFFNVPVEEAMRRIQSGLAGMARPLREFGVLINDAKIKAKAFQMGLADQNGTVTESAKVLARYELIVQGLAIAEGDIERSQGRYAMQIRMLAGNFENLAASIGQSVLPVFTSFTSSLNTLLVKADELWRFMVKLGPLLGDAFGGIIFGGVPSVNYDPSAEVPDAGLADIDNRNAELAEERNRLNEEEANIKNRKGRGAGYGDLASLYNKIQDAISGGQNALLKDLGDIAKQQLKVEKEIKKAIEGEKKATPMPLQMGNNIFGM